MADRCGLMRALFVMNARTEHRRGAIVIGRTNRGLERGEVLCEATDHVLGQLKDPAMGNIQREATPDDENEHRRLLEQQKRAQGRTPSSPLVLGFLVNWDEASFDSLKKNFSHIDILVPEWLHLKDATGNIASRQ